MAGVTVPDVRLFIQARMSSARFPGKVLAPFCGRPLIASTISRAADALGIDRIVLATTTDDADDPLAAYVRELGVMVFRGSRDNVLGRLQECLAAFPCRRFFRVCADSPLVDVDLIREMAAYAARPDLDLVTNVFPRTFPKGQSLELIAADTFAAIDGDLLDDAAREHVTRVYYDQPARFRILNLTAPDHSCVGLNLAVDTLDDLRRIEALASAGNWHADVSGGWFPANRG